MSTIRTGTGLFSGIDFATLTSQLIAAQRAPARRLESRLAGFQNIQVGVQTLEANILTLSTSVTQLKSATTFNQTRVTNSDPAQLSVTATASAKVGSYALQVHQLASSEQRLSRGFANSDQQKIGAGTITISQGGELSTATRLDTFNGGQGVQRGSIRVTDRSGASVTVDLSKAYSIDDVLSAINTSNSISVTARTDGGRIILEDTSGSTSVNLQVAEIGNGKTAADLGLKQSVAADQLTGSDVFYLTSDFTLDQLNDGNGIFQLTAAPDLKFTLQDGTQFEVNLDNLFNVGEVLSAINDHAGNGGKLAASLSGSQIVLTDSTVGAGTLAVENINGSTAVESLGLDNAASGGVLTGDRLLAGIGSRLLRNLRGGQGISTTGQVSLTDRTGRSTTIDLTAAQSLDEVINAINSAEDGGTRLTLTARLNSKGTGIEVVDTSGASASNLVIADVGGSTLATELGIAVDAASASVDSGSLDLRRVSRTTSLDRYAPDGGSVELGSFLITDSVGGKATISLSSTIKTIGDVIQRINAASGVNVIAKLNSTGDGFLIEDNAGGPGTLQIDEITGTTAADLRILGSGTAEGGGSQQIHSRKQTVITVDENDTLDSLVTKIGAQSSTLVASVVNDGSTFNSFRLSLSSKQAGSAGRVIIDTGGLNLGLTVTTEARDSLLQVGSNVATSFLVASSGNQFNNVVPGINVRANAVGSTAAQATVNPNTDSIKNALKSLVTSYNSFIDTSDILTKFDEDPAKRGALQGQGIVIRVKSRLDSLLTKNYFGTTASIQSLSDIGVRVTTGGKLSFDEAVFDTTISEDPEAVKSFFLDSTLGVGKKLDEALNSLTDSNTGVFAVTSNGLKNSIESLQKRVGEIDALLAVRQERLLLQFINMESTIGKLQTQQDALAGLASISKNSSNN